MLTESKFLQNLPAFKERMQNVANSMASGKKLPDSTFIDMLIATFGGISPENVQQELKKIAQVVSKEREIFIDAEGQLKGDDKHFSIQKAEKYLRNACECEIL